MGKATGQLAPRTVAALDAMAELWAAVDEHQSGILPERPPNSITVYEYMEREGLGRQTAEGRLRKLVDAGILSRAKCQVFSGGAMRVTNVYTKAQS